eukprot:6213288-Pleurochrysis_carterae.AAC.3
MCASRKVYTRLLGHNVVQSVASPKATSNMLGEARNLPNSSFLHNLACRFALRWLTTSDLGSTRRLEGAHDTFWCARAVASTQVRAYVPLWAFKCVPVVRERAWVQAQT